MPTYKELLESIEWKTKRKEILQRDRLKCTVCLNEKIIKDTLIGSIRFSHNTDNLSIFYISGKPIFFPLHLNIEKLDLRLYYNLKNDAVQVVAVKKANNLDELLEAREYIESFFKEHKSDQEHMLSFFSKALNISKEDLTMPNVQLHLKKTEWLDVKGLHVHHKYYQLGLMPWDYPEDALTTVCWICHKELHKDVKVPLLNEQGIQISTLTPCPRCFGAGMFPEYLHVQEGICFECEGACFEEFYK